MNRYYMVILNTLVVPLFATPPFCNTAPFLQHFFEKFVFCLGTPFCNTSKKNYTVWTIPDLLKWKYGI